MLSQHSSEFTQWCIYQVTLTLHKNYLKNYRANFLLPFLVWKKTNAFYVICLMWKRRAKTLTKVYFIWESSDQKGLWVRAKQKGIYHHALRHIVQYLKTFSAFLHQLWIWLAKLSQYLPPTLQKLFKRCFFALPLIQFYSLKSARFIFLS